MTKARQIEGIDCKDPARVGIKLVLIERFDEMQKHRQAALNFDDPEGVHSMRVACRRLRSALRDFMPYMKKRGLAATLKAIKDIGDVLGEVRDEDVGIEALEKLSAKTSPHVSMVLNDIIEKRKSIRADGRKELENLVQDSKLKQLRSEFEAAINIATDGNVQRVKESESLSYIRMGQAIIRDRLAELESLSSDLYKPFDVEALHEMRIAEKRLRYAIELFDACSKPSLMPVAKRAARLQAALGKVHDCDVWIENFGKQSIDSKRKQEHQQMRAFAWLLSHFMKIRTAHVREAFSIWNKWESDEVSRKLRQALKSE